MSQTILTVEQMDCPTEEGLIRKRLEGMTGIKSLHFNLLERELTVEHSLSEEAVLAALSPLDLGARLEQKSRAQSGTNAQTVLAIEAMDCPTEEGLIRKKLEGMAGIQSLSFNLLQRELTVTHALSDDALLAALGPLDMGARVKANEPLSSRVETVFSIEKMDCPTEEGLIRKRLQGMPGIENLTFNLLERELSVTHTLPESAVLTALAPLEMDARVKATAASKPCDACDGEITGKSSVRRAWIILAVSGVLAVSGEILALILDNESSPIVIACAMAAILLGGRRTLWKGWIALKTFTLNINFLMSLAVVGAIAIGEWPEAAMVIVLFALAEAIEALSLDRARNAIRQLMQMTPETAEVRQPDGSWREQRAADIAADTLLRVKPGQRIPLDGEVVAGRSSVDQAAITGESMPVDKGVGDKVFAGTLNQMGVLEMRVTARYNETTLARIIRSVQEAQAQRAPTQRFIDQFARYYTPTMVVAAALVAVIPPLIFGAEFTPWLYKALVLLVIACPCALVISTPVTIVSGLAAAARSGILVKGGAYLEQAYKLKMIALDKTGTLTHGKPKVTDVVPLRGQTKNGVLELAAGIAWQSEHPVANAIFAASRAAEAASDRPLPSVEHFETLVGRGVKAQVGGELLYLGNHRLIEELGICSPELEKVLTALERDGKSVSILANASTTLAIFAVADTLRDSSIEAIRQLHGSGVATVILTGDNQVTAGAIAKRAGIDTAMGNLLPADKLAALDRLLTQYGRVGMVGDGINDAPALAKASIGFAMGAAGTDTAIETADVALMKDDLRKLPEFIELSRRTAHILTQNIAFALTTKLVFFGLALAGMATLWMAVFADMGASLIVVANGLRLLRSAPRTETVPVASLAAT